MYGNRISVEMYKELCKKEHVHDLIVQLKSTSSYGHLFKNKQASSLHRVQLEDLLQAEYYTRIEKMLRYRNKKQDAFYLQTVRYIEIRMVLDKLLQFIYCTSSITSMGSVLEKYVRFNVTDFMNTSSLDELRSVVSRLKIDSYLNYDFLTIENYRVIEKQLLDLYYDDYVCCIKTLFKGKKRQTLLDILYTSIELKNIEKIYRLKMYYNVEDVSDVVCLKYSRLSKTLLEQIQNSPAEDVLKVLSHSTYDRYYDRDEFVYIEYYTEMIKYNIAKRFMRFSNDAPIVFMTYCLLQQIEIDNLKHIIEGVRYKKEASSIESFLIYM